MKIINKILNIIIMLLSLVIVFILFINPSYYLDKVNKEFDLEELIEEGSITGLDKLKSIGNLVSESTNTKNYGSTGNEYTFDSLYYPYYSNLDDEEKPLYKQIYANAFDFNKDFNPIVDIYKDDISRVFEAVLYDHPELFWLDNSYSYQYNIEGKCVEINLKFNDTFNNIEENRNMFNKEVNSILTEANRYRSELEKEKYVHNILVNNLVYDNDSLYNQSAFSAIVFKTSVCAGYSKAFQYILQKLDIPCYYVTGTSTVDHAWNIVKLGDYYYNVDLTWDNTGNDAYEYFNKSDNYFSSTHQRSEMSSFLPRCLGSRYK